MSEKKLKFAKTDLDDDAIYDLFYNILWTKETLYEEPNYRISIPDTVIYRTGTPVSWYFSNSEGILLKKKDSNLKNEIVLNHFLTRKNSHGILAYFISIPYEKDGIL